MTTPWIQGVGWFSRRIPEPLPTIAFYRDVMGLTSLRGREQSAMFWAGETATFWVNPGGEWPPAYTDRSQAGWIPVFRTWDVEHVWKRLEAGGARYLQDKQLQAGRMLYFLDPSGNVTGLQERSDASPRAHDSTARRRWDAKELGVTDLPPLPEDIHGLAWVLGFVSDSEKVRTWYRDVLGCPVAEGTSVMLDAGAELLLEFLDGGPPPQQGITDRKQVSNAPIFRTHRFEELCKRVEEHGLTWVNPPFMGSGKLAYGLDPDGRLIGIQERLPDSPRPEDIEAAKRWKAIAGG